MNRTKSIRRHWKWGLLALVLIILAGLFAFGPQLSAQTEKDAPPGEIENGAPADDKEAPTEASDPVPQTLSCFDDNLENNDTLATARAVTRPFQRFTLRSCPFDDDWYSFGLSAGEPVRVDAFFTDANGDINLRLVNPAGVTVCNSKSITNNEKCNFTATSTGTHFVRVHLFGATPPLGNSYKLRISAPGCVDDTLEQNDTQATARLISRPFQRSGLRSCPNDDDWYRFSLSAGEQVRVTAFFTVANGNIDLRVVRPTGAIACNAKSVNNNEGCNVIATSTGTHFVRVHLFGATPPHGNSYKLRVSQCTDDALEQNDSRARARAITVPFQRSGLRSCANDDDWYSFPLTTGKQVRVDVFFTDANGDIDLGPVVNPAGFFICNSKSITDNEKCNFTATTTGTYFVRVYLSLAAPVQGNSYKLRITTIQPRPTDTPTPTVTPTPTATPTATPTSGPPQGDVNCDGLVNVVDALFILQGEVGLRVDSGGCPLPPPPPDTLNAAGGDVNKDGLTNVVDALFILQCEVGQQPGAGMPFCLAQRG